MAKNLHPINNRFWLFTLFSGLVSASVATANETEEIANRLAIMDMLTQYSYRWDGKDSQAFSELFTEEAVMERRLNGELGDGSRLEGRASILEYARQSHKGRLADRQTRHYFSGIVFLELNAESAITENMALITHQTANDSAAYISSSGIYRIIWQKTPEGWRMHERVLTSDRYRN